MKNPMDRDRMRPRGKRDKTELQVYRQGLLTAAQERRETMAARLEANWEAKFARAREFRDAALDRREKLIARLEAVRDAARTGTLAELPSEATRIVEIRDPERSGMWTGLAVGLGVAAVVGMAGVMVYLLVRKRDGEVVGVKTVQGFGHTAPQLMTGGGEVSRTGSSPELNSALEAIAKAPDAPRGLWRSSSMKSYVLPSLNDKTRGAIRVAQATDVPYEIVMRTIGPPGQYAAFSMNVGELNTSTGVPVGDVILLPTSQWQVMKLKPHEVLYAKGSQANVIISVTSNEVDGGSRAML